MASSIPASADAGSLEPLRKRQRVDDIVSTNGIVTSSNMDPGVQSNIVPSATNIAAQTMGYEAEKEAAVGILRYVNEVNPGFTGILKQRYTDFLVNEIDLDGKVIHLTTVRAPRREHVKQVWDKTSQVNVQEVTAKSENTVGEEVASQSTEPPQATSDLNETNSVDKTGLADNSATPKSLQPESSEVTAKGLFRLSDSDSALLDSYFGEAMRQEITKLHDKMLANPEARPFTFGSLFTQPMQDRQLRGEMHQNIRRMFDSRFETAVDDANVIKITCAPRKRPANKNGGKGRAPRINGNQPRGKLGWDELGGEHLHFSLYKENKDTMEIISLLARLSKQAPRNFSFAGTKDRRAVTVQRVSGYRMRAEELVALNRGLRNAQIGDFKHEKHALDLGYLTGNEFVITLRDCCFEESDDLTAEQRVEVANRVVGNALRSMQADGFINYFGLQRFGSFHTGTHSLGRMILQGNFEGAIQALLEYDPKMLEVELDETGFNTTNNLPRDDILRAQGIHIFKTTGRINDAVSKLPRKFSGENSVIRHLGRRPGDFLGALLSINRQLRLMYVHAYQSLVWNLAASERFARFGNKVVKGDLVMISSKASKAALEKDEVDENGEIIVRPAGDEFATSTDDIFERARPLTEEEAASGTYTMFDIVLPTPGFDIEYPANEVGDYYKEFMSSERGGGLDPGNMRRPQKDFSLSGSYRKVLSSIGSNATFEIKPYQDDLEQMVETDLERLQKSDPTTINSDNHRSGAQNQGGKQNGRHNHGQRNDGHEQHQENRAAQDQGEAIRKVQTSAWQGLPDKLKAEDRGARLAAEAREAAEAADPTLKGTIMQPTIVETYIETKAETGQRTGRVESDIAVGNEGSQPVGSEAAETVPNSASAANGASTAATTSPSAPATEHPSDAAHNVPSAAPPERIPALGSKRQRSPDVDAAPQARTKIATILRFQLGTSQYATMALRELMKQGGVKAYKPDFNTGR